MLQQRQVHIDHDKQLILEFHCQTNYECDSLWARQVPYEKYREKWFSTSQPDEFYSYLKETIKDPRTIAEVWLDRDTNRTVGYIWMVFNDIEEYDLVIAEILDIIVTPEFQGRGIGLHMFEYLEKNAMERGANLLRSETGIENVRSQKLHEKSGLSPYRVLYEKRLR